MALYGSGAAALVPGEDGGEFSGQGTALAVTAEGGDDPSGWQVNERLPLETLTADRDRA